jgi:hypothetical protein
LFSVPVFRHVQVLVAGALLTRGRHTVTNALRLMGLGGETAFQVRVPVGDHRRNAVNGTQREATDPLKEKTVSHSVSFLPHC